MIGPIVKKNGFVMVFVLCFIALIILICVAYSLAALNSLSLSANITNSMRAYYIADAGLADAFVKLRDPMTAPGSFNVYNTNYPVGPGNRKGNYSVTVLPDQAPPWSKYTITSTGTYGASSKTLQLKVCVASVTIFTYLSNIEIDEYGWQEYWGTGNILTGRIHTNGQLNIFGFPEFDGPVEQHASTINYWTGAPYGPLFNGGLTLGAPIISLPDSTYFTGQIKNSAGVNDGSNPYHLSGDTSITLLPDGTLLISNAISGNPSIASGIPLPMPPSNAIFVEGGTVSVHGRLKGQLTIGCDHNILVNDSIIYNTDPRHGASSTDMLGLVTDGSVVLTNPTLSGSNNIEIDASMVALNGCFELQDFDKFLRGDLIMFGGLACNYYGPNGIFDGGGHLIAGYYQQQIYDERLETSPPPCYTPAKDNNNRICYYKMSFAEMR